MNTWRNDLHAVAGMSMRGADRLLPLPGLRIVTWPAAAAYSAYQLLFRGPTFRQFRDLPPTLRPDPGRSRWVWRLWSSRTALVMTKLTRYLPDRLHEARWQSQCRWQGVEWLDSVLASGRPAILATLHYGNLDSLGDWLRARGVTASFLSNFDPGQVPDYRKHVGSLRDHALGMSGIPRRFQVNQLWDVRDFLSRPGRVLIVAFDAYHKKHVMVQGEGYRLRLSTGALRLAAIVNAAVIPCLIRAPRGLSSAIEFGCPVPDEDVSDPHRHQAACEHIVGEILPLLRSFPEQCDSYFLRCGLDTAVGPET